MYKSLKDMSYVLKIYIIHNLFQSIMNRDFLFLSKFFAFNREHLIAFLFMYILFYIFFVIIYLNIIYINVLVHILCINNCTKRNDQTLQYNYT